MVKEKHELGFFAKYVLVLTGLCWIFIFNAGAHHFLSARVGYNDISAPILLNCFDLSFTDIAAIWHNVLYMKSVSIIIAVVFMFIVIPIFLRKLIEYTAEKYENSNSSARCVLTLLFLSLCIGFIIFLIFSAPNSPPPSDTSYYQTTARLLVNTIYIGIASLSVLLFFRIINTTHYLINSIALITIISAILIPTFMYHAGEEYKNSTYAVDIHPMMTEFCSVDTPPEPIQ